MTSSNRIGDLSSSDGGQHGAEQTAPHPAPPRDDEQTVISNRPPPGAGKIDPAHGIAWGNLKPGDVIGHYEILDYVGGGGMGRVFRAHDTQLDRQVALKVLPLDQAADVETVLRFRNEARSGARLDHENIARVYHVGEDQGFPYLVFEFVEGTTIRAMVDQRGPLPLGEAVSYTLQVADALAHAAEQDVVHRDIKPSNLIITRHGRVKVIDLGLARIQQIEHAATDLTASGVTLGTFDYISPEQARDPRLVDTRSDIYSLGCALFFMLSGRPPFPEGTVLQKLLQHQGDKPPDIHEFRPELPEEVSRVLQKMLAKDPKDRYQTATELVAQLQWLAERIGLRPMGPGRRHWGSPRKIRTPFFQRHLPWMAPVAALLCVVVALHILWNVPAIVTSAQAPETVPQDPGVGPPEDVAATPPEAPAGEPGADPTRSDGVIIPAPDPGDTRIAPTDPGADGIPTSADIDAAVLAARSAASHGVDVAPGRPSNGNMAGSPGGSNGSSRLPGAVSGADVSIDPAVLPEGLMSDDFPWAVPETSTTQDRGAGVLTVGSRRGGARDFPSLSAACAAARAGEIIELCYNGRREERPIDLPGGKLTVRAAPDCRPIIVFRPNQDDPVEYHRSMFTLGGGEFSMLGVAVELEIPRALSGSRWALWELGEGARLRLQQTSLTVGNPYGHEVSVFRTKASTESDLTESSPAVQGLTPIDVTLTDCVIRGQAVTVLAKSLRPIRLSWTNGLLSTSEWFLWTRGGDRSPVPGEAIEVELRHVTARAEKGLCLLDNSRLAPCQLPVKVNCSDSVLLVTSSQGALVEQFGEHPTNLEEPWFAWTGDRNAYQGSTVFWRVEDFRADGTTTLLEFDQWQQQWPDQEVHSRAGPVEFVSPLLPEHPSDVASPADFRLKAAIGNWARGNASDSTDVGAAVDRLPPVPPRPAPASSEAPAMRTPRFSPFTGAMLSAPHGTSPPWGASQNTAGDTPRPDGTWRPGQSP